MAQFSVHQLKGSGGLVIDCQSDLLDDLESRFVVPLVTLADAPRLAHRFNPVFEIDGVNHAMLTQFSGAVDRRQLGPAVVSLTGRSFEITGALDVLIGGV